MFQILVVDDDKNTRMLLKADRPLPDFAAAILCEELNVKAVEPSEDVSAYTSYTFKPQLKTVGPKYGKQLGAIRSYLSEVDGSAAMATLRAEGALTLVVGDVTVRLTEEDLLISAAQKEGYVSMTDRGITVVLDTALTEALVEEGFVRELVSKLQTMRKDSGFEVTDHIRVGVAGNAKLAALMETYRETLLAEVLGEELVTDATLAHSKVWSINGEEATLSVEKV